MNDGCAFLSRACELGRPNGVTLGHHVTTAGYHAEWGVRADKLGVDDELLEQIQIGDRLSHMMSRMFAAVPLDAAHVLHGYPHGLANTLRG